MVNHLNVTGTELTGDIYNGSGYYGQTAVGIEVNLGKDAVLSGAVAQTCLLYTSCQCCYRKTPKHNRGSRAEAAPGYSERTLHKPG